MRSLAKSWLGLLLLCLVTVASINVFAAETVVDETQVETRLKALSTELRCLVCQNTTLADSNAGLAEDLRNEIRTLLREGKTDEEVKAYLVARYGEFVLYRPPVQANTLLLWFGPFVMLFIGVVILVVVLKKRASQPEAVTPIKPKKRR
jgi:cytochrome c-type biogenesis protein CcmH